MPPNLAAGIVALAALVLGVSDADGGSSYTEVARLPGSASTIGLAGPTLSGAAVLWGEREQDGSVSVRRATLGARGTTTVYRAPAPALPPDAGRPGYEVIALQQVATVASTATRVAFVRTVILDYRPRCLDDPTPCGAPSFAVPLFADLWSGPASGPVHRLAGGSVSTLAGACKRWRPTSVDLPRAGVVYSEQLDPCARSSSQPRRARVVRLVGGRRSVLATVSKGALGPVAAAGSWAAWRADSASSKPTLVVSSLRDRVLRYRVGLRTSEASTFDVDKRGTIALTFRPSGPCGALELAVATPFAQTPRSLRVWTKTPVVRIDGGRVLAAVERTPCAPVTELALVGVRGHRQSLVSFRDSEPRSLADSFALQGRRFAFASTQRAGTGAATFTTSVYIGTVGAEARTSVGSGEGRNRTGDTTVFSRVLYRLSYLARGAKCSRAGPVQNAGRNHEISPRPGVRAGATAPRTSAVTGR